MAYYKQVAQSLIAQEVRMVETGWQEVIDEGVNDSSRLNAPVHVSGRKLRTLPTFVRVLCFILVLGLVVSVGELIAYNAIPTQPVTVTKENYEEFFRRNGYAHSNYNAKTGVQTLTADKIGWQLGRAEIKDKIDFAKDFKLEMLVNLGNKTSEEGGADGMAFFFHPGSVDEIGGPGGALGVSGYSEAGIQGAFGFKLDTFCNQADNARHRWYSVDPQQFAGKAFGAFISTQGVDKTGRRDRAIAPGYGQIISSPAPREIPRPSGNKFRRFSLRYDASTKRMTVDYAGIQWSRRINDWLKGYDGMYFTISGATSEKYANEHQFILQKLEYMPVKVIAKFF